SNLDTKIPVLGQALSAASTPVVLPAAQVTALTPPTTITANIGNTNGLVLDNTITGGNQKTKLTDGTNNVALSNTSPLGTEYSLITRNIPSGIQAVNGTVTVSNTEFLAYLEGIYNSTLPTITNGNKANLQLSSRGE